MVGWKLLLSYKRHSHIYWIYTFTCLLYLGELDNFFRSCCCSACGSSSKTALDRINLGLPSSVHDAIGNRCWCSTEKAYKSSENKENRVSCNMFMCASKFSIIYGRRSEDFSFSPFCSRHETAAKELWIGGRK
jgi:hypothetical protein